MKNDFICLFLALMLFLIVSFNVDTTHKNELIILSESVYAQESNLKGSPSVSPQGKDVEGKKEIKPSPKAKDPLTEKKILEKLRHSGGKPVSPQFTLKKTIKKDHEKFRKAKFGYPVKIGNKTLFRLSATLGDWTAEKRAKYLSNLLNTFSTSPDIDPKKLKAVYDKEYNISNIYYDEIPVMIFKHEDAAPYGISVKIAGKMAVEEIRDKVYEIRKQEEAKRLRVGYTVGISGILILLLLFLLIQKLGKWLADKVRAMKGSWIKSIKVRNTEILSDESFLRFILVIGKIAKILIFLNLIYIYFNYFLIYIPGTESIRSVLYEYPVNYIKNIFMAIITYIPKLIFIVIIIIITHYTIKLNEFIFGLIRKGSIKIPGFHPEFHDITYKLDKFVIYFFAIVLIAPNLPGYSSPIFQGLSVLTAIVISLSSSTSVANILAGVVIAYTRSMRVGDWVKIGDNLGEVKEMTLLAIKLRTVESRDVSIPNAVVLQGNVVNFSSGNRDIGGVLISTNLSIGYDVPGEKVEELCLKGIDFTDGILEKPSPFVLQKSLDDFFVTYVINAYTDKPQRMRQIYSNLHSNIRKCFDEAGVEIMSPHYTSLRDGNMTTVPQKYMQGNKKSG